MLCVRARACTPYNHTDTHTSTSMSALSYTHTHANARARARAHAHNTIAQSLPFRSIAKARAHARAWEREIDLPELTMSRRCERCEDDDESAEVDESAASRLSLFASRMSGRVRAYIHAQVPRVRRPPLAASCLNASRRQVSHHHTREGLVSISTSHDSMCKRLCVLLFVDVARARARARSSAPTQAATRSKQTESDRMARANMARSSSRFLGAGCGTHMIRSSGQTYITNTAHNKRHTRACA